jgi:cytidine deaminase
MLDEQLIDRAMEVRDRAYAKYSKFKVGAALLCEDGRVFEGCNIENLSYGLTICAERVALGAAVAAGVQRFSCIAIVSDSDVPISPCGACRQVLAEFAPNLRLLLATAEGRRCEYSLDVLFPRPTEGILDREP